MSKYMESNMGEDDQESGGRAATGERPVVGLSRKRVCRRGEQFMVNPLHEIAPFVLSSRARTENPSHEITPLALSSTARPENRTDDVTPIASPSTARPENPSHEFAPFASSPEKAFQEITPFASSSTPQTPPRYEVFINHRGRDTKSTLASSIYHFLEHLGVKAFYDREELDLGNLIPQAIEDAMGSALIHIAIFSKGYAESPWCLAELAFMVKTGAPIIPVFYYVEPGDLKWGAKKLYGEAFSEHEKSGRYDEATLENWKSALHEASLNSGCEFKSNDDGGVLSDEGVLLKRIVNRVQQEIANVKVPFEVALYPVGLDDAVKSFEDAIGRSVPGNANVQIVGIAGISGCGKTTLARELYNRKCKGFNNRCFLSEVKDAALYKLQKKLLRDLLNFKHLSSKDSSELKSILTWRFKSFSAPMLIVLDDVDHVNQLNALLPAKGSTLGSGSLIIITTCDLGILRSWGISSVFEMPKLDMQHAKKLFCLHAFCQPFPANGFEDLVKGFINACDRLPLSLKVIAEMLCGKPKEEWISNLEQISELPEEVEKRMRLSYNALKKQEQDIFLDIACFFVGEKKNLAIAVWDAADWRGLQSLEILVNKCLVEVDMQNRIKMHNHLRDLGRQIAAECPPHRLWSPKQISKITRSMRSMQERTVIRGIMAATTQLVASSAHEEFPKCCDRYRPCFEEWMDLRFLELLVVAGEYFSASDFPKLSMDLVWLRLFDFEDTDLPSWLSLTKLRVLELYGASGLQLWENKEHAPDELREIIITATKGNSFYSFPCKISDLKHLTKIALISDYGAEFQFETLPDELCRLESLKHLELRHCRLLIELPNYFGKLKRLEHLDLFSCEMLWKLPESFKELTELEYLDLSGCRNLLPMQDILQNMTKLKNLYFAARPKLEELPLHIGDQHSLRELHLQKTMLRYVPSNINQLSKLENLRIGSPHLSELPTSFGNLSNLTNLKITGCINLEALPQSLEKLMLLESFCLKSSAVRSLPEGFSGLSNLRTLKIFDCPIAELDFGSVSYSCFWKLKVIHLKGTEVTRVSISQKSCPSLETIRLEQNYDLREVEILATSVKTVKMYECTTLHNIKGIPDLQNLDTLDIAGCEELDEDTVAAITMFQDRKCETQRIRSP